MDLGFMRFSRRRNGRLPAPATGLPALVTGENKILQEHETGDADFLLVPAAGDRPFLPLENVNTSYHSEFQQILSINVVGEHIFKKRCQNFTFQKLPKIWLSFLTILTEKFFFANRSQMV